MPTATRKAPKAEAVERHIRVMLPDADHRRFRVLSAESGESMYQHARRVLLDYIRAKVR